MTTATSALPTPLTLDDWAEHPFAEGDRVELVRGYITMAPHENADNRMGTSQVVHQVLSRVAHRTAVTDFDVVISEVPATIRLPDVVVARPDVLRGRNRVEAREVDLVVEFVSPSSVETDWVTKRDEYAAAGVSAYLVVDLRGDTPRMALFEHPIAGHYPDPTGDGRSATIRLGDDTLTLTLADLLP